jgi:hypothetical protein
MRGSQVKFFSKSLQQATNMYSNTEMNEVATSLGKA